MTVIKFKASPKNVGPVTVNDRQVLTLCWGNGAPVMAGELRVDHEYSYTLDPSGEYFIVKTVGVKPCSSC